LTGARSSSTTAAAVQVANGENVAEALAGKEEGATALEGESSTSPKKMTVIEGGEGSKSPLLTSHRMGVASGDMDEVNLEGRLRCTPLAFGRVSRCGVESVLL